MMCSDHIFRKEYILVIVFFLHGRLWLKLSVVLCPTPLGQVNEPNTGNLVGSSSKFLDSKDTGYNYICSEFFIFFKVSFTYEIVSYF